jgi:hypothetical protein
VAYITGEPCNRLDRSVYQQPAAQRAGVGDFCPGASPRAGPAYQAFFSQAAQQRVRGAGADVCARRQPRLAPVLVRVIGYDLGRANGGSPRPRSAALDAAGGGRTRDPSAAGHVDETHALIFKARSEGLIEQALDNQQQRRPVIGRRISLD